MTEKDERYFSELDLPVEDENVKPTLVKPVSKLSDYTNNTLQVSPEQAIQDFQEFLKENPDYNKVFLVAVNTKNQGFNINWFKGRMLCSEAVVALTMAVDDQVRVLRGEEV